MFRRKFKVDIESIENIREKKSKDEAFRQLVSRVESKPYIEPVVEPESDELTWQNLKKLKPLSKVKTFGPNVFEKIFKDLNIEIPKRHGSRTIQETMHALHENNITLDQVRACLMSQV